MTDKEHMGSLSSPRSDGSLHTESLDLAIKSLVQTSIEQLYQNIYDIQSSDHSPTRCTSISFDNESRMDSELRHLVGGMGTRDDNELELKVNGVAHQSSPNICKSQSSSKFVPSKSRTRNRLLHEKGSSKLGRSKSLGKTKVKPIDSKLGSQIFVRETTGLLASIENPKNLFEFIRRSFEQCANESQKLEMVMSLHVLAARFCSLGQFRNAISILKHCIELPEIKGQNHCLARFSGYMQLGDVYMALGEMGKSIKCYTTGMGIQRRVLGDKDPRFGTTCRYVAEAYLESLQFDEAENLCEIALRTHKCDLSVSMEEAEDRKLLGLISESKGDHETSLEHYVLARMAMAANGRGNEVASIDCSIGDAYSALARYDEAICAYQKALAVIRSSKGESHPVVASVYTRMAHLYHKVGKLRESKSCRQNALQICRQRVKGVPVEEFASVVLDVSSIFQLVDDLDQALELLQIARKIYNGVPGNQSIVAAVEAQIGVIQYMLGKYLDSYNSFKTAILMMRKFGEKKSAPFGIALNQMALACVQCDKINEAAELFEEAKDILEKEYGPYHYETLAVYSNLAGIYDAIGRLDDAIKILDYVVEVREEKHGTANPEVQNEKQRLLDLLKESGKVHIRRFRSLEELLEDEHHAEGDDRIRLL